MDQTNKWFVNECTTCQREVEKLQNYFICSNCPRTVPHPDKRYQNNTNVYQILTLQNYIFNVCKFNIRYKINVSVKDEIGGIDLILGDRQVRTLIGKRARDLYDEV